MKRLIVALALLVSTVTAPIALTVPAHATSQRSALGDLTKFEKIASDTLALAKKNEMKAAEARITDFETAWDQAEPTLYPKNHDQWGMVDEASDAAITALRTHPQVQADAETAVAGLIATLKNPAGQ
jgi:hypothetical protein